MRTLKTLIVACFCSIAISGVAQNSNAVPQKRTDYIKQHVSNISSDQESKILTIEQDCSSAMQNAQNTRAKDSIRRSSDTQIKAVLTPDQYTQYEKIKKNLPKENKGSY